MRVFFCFVFVATCAAGTALSQDTTFANGPQYSPEFGAGRSIRTLKFFRALHFHALHIAIGSGSGSRREQCNR